MSDVRLLLDGELGRSRLTVFFRPLLAIFHLIWFVFWAYAVSYTSFAQWVITVVRGRPARPLQRFHLRFVRFVSHLTAYLTLVAAPLPSVLGDPGYPFDLEVDVAERQPRASAAFRLVLALPPLVLLVFVTTGVLYVGIGVLVAVWGLGWFAALATGAMPRGLRDLGAWGIRYAADVFAYALLLTRAYPDSNPIVPAGTPPPARPIRLQMRDDLRRSRLTAFFRLFLAVPHLVWLTGWALLAIPAALANWVVTLVAGRPAIRLARFLAAFVRYQTHLGAFLFLVANPFPGFSGTRDYPLTLAIDPPGSQRRWTTALRLLLALPAAIVSNALNGVLVGAGIGIWFAALATGRAPEGLRNVGALALGYTAQLNGYLYLLTDAYPYSGPPVAPPRVETVSAPVA